MQSDEDFEKLKKNDSSFHKLEFDLTQECIGNMDWEGIKEGIRNNTVVREVHVRMSKEFVELFDLNEIIELFKVLGRLQNLKYMCLGQMTGAVSTFCHIPVQAMTAMLEQAQDTLLWFYLRGIIVQHIYKGSEEEQEDLGESSATMGDDSKREKKKKSKKEKDKKEKKDSKEKKKKKDKKKDKHNESSRTDLNLEDETESGHPDGDFPVDKKQAAARRALEKCGEAISKCKLLKKVSFMCHFNEEMYACRLDPLLEGLAVCEELDLVVFAVTRHDGRILVDSSALGTFFDGCPSLKEASIIFIKLSEDHMDEVAGAVAKHKTLESLTLTGTGSTTAEPIGTLMRATNLKKLSLQELYLDEQCVVALAIGLAHFNHLEELEIQCKLKTSQAFALSQMVSLNQGLQTLHLHLTLLADVSTPLDLVAAVLANPNSNMKKIIIEAKNEECEKISEISLDDWRYVNVTNTCLLNAVRAVWLCIDYDLTN